MANEQINIVMQIVDKVTAVNDKIKWSLNSVKGTLEKNAEAFKIAWAVSGAAFAGLSFVIGKSISEAKEAQMINAQLEAVLKSTGGTVWLTAEQIRNYASELQSTTGIADDVIQSGQNMLLTFTNIGKDVFPGATNTLLDMATAMNGGATPSAEALKGSAIQLGKALNDPIEGISALSRVWVTFTEQQKKQIEAMVEMWDVAGAQKLILAELNREFWGSAAAQAATFEGRMRILKETMNGVFETIGTALLPVLTNLAVKITPIVEKIANWINDNPKLTATIIGIATGVAGFTAALSAMWLIIPSVITWFTLLNVAIGPIGWTIIGITALVAALALAWKTNFLGIQDITSTAWKFIQDGFAAFKALFSWDFEGFWLLILEMWHNLFENIKSKFPDFYKSFSELWEKVENITATILARVVIFVITKANAIRDTLQKMKDTLLEIATLWAANTQTYNPGTWGGGGQVPARAFWGDVWAWQPTKVWEDWEEIFVPQVNGRIMNNKETRGMWGTSIIINMWGVTVTSEADEDRLVDKISTRLGREYRLSQSSIY